MKILGVDPGKNGAFASYDGEVLTTYKMPKCPARMTVLINELTKSHDLVVVERVTGWFPGAKMAFASRGFTMGCWFYGPVCAALSVDPSKVKFVMSAQWQRDLGCLSGGDKKLLVEYARKMHPQFRIINQVADAVLIASWGFASREKLLRKRVYESREFYISNLVNRKQSGATNQTTQTPQLHNHMAKKSATKKAAAKPAAKKAAAKPAAKSNEKKNYILTRYAKALGFAVADSRVTSDEENGSTTSAYRKARKEVQTAIEESGASTFDGVVEASGADSEVVQKSLNDFFAQFDPNK